MHLAVFYRLDLILLKKTFATRMLVMGKFLLILLILVSTNAFAAVSKWVDDHGRVHYSDQPPPPEVKAETLHSAPVTESTAGVSGVAAPKTIAEREADLKKAQQAKKEAAEKDAQKQAAAEALKASCATAQQNLRTLQSDLRMIEVNANGDRSYMDDTQRQQRITKAQQDVSTYCK